MSEQEPSLPSVTAVIPCHNHVQWVLDAIESVASQNYKNKRIVVVDDGSTDGSFERVADSLYKPRRLTDKDVRIAVGRTPNHPVDLIIYRFETASGPSFARNHGIKAAWDGTDIFAFLDSDDMYEPGKISQSVERFMEAPQLVGAVYSDYDTLSPKGTRFREYKEPYSRARLVQECIVNCDSLVNKAALGAAGLFDEELRVCEDFDLWLRISESHTLVHIPESLVTIRVGSHSATGNVQKDVWEACYKRVMQKTHERAKS